MILNNYNPHRLFASTSSSFLYSRGTPLVRQSQRTRPYVPQPRSVINRAGYLPAELAVDLIPTFIRSNQISTSAPSVASQNRKHEGDEAESQRKSELVAKNSAPRQGGNQVSLPRSPSYLEAMRQEPVVTIQEDRATKKVLMKDAAVNTTAEILVLPKGTKTSVLLKTGEVNGAKDLRICKKKLKGLRRIARFFGRIMIRIVEIF